MSARRGAVSARAFLNAPRARKNTRRAKNFFEASAHTRRAFGSTRCARDRRKHARRPVCESQKNIEKSRADNCLHRISISVQMTNPLPSTIDVFWFPTPKTHRIRVKNPI
jgi:hypothetical protein